MKRKGVRVDGHEEALRALIEQADDFFSDKNYDIAYRILADVVSHTGYLRHLDFVKNREILCAYYSYKSVQYKHNLGEFVLHSPPGEHVPREFNIRMRICTYIYYLEEGSSYAKNEDFSKLYPYLPLGYDTVLENEVLKDVSNRQITHGSNNLFHQCLNGFLASLFLSGAFKTYPGIVDLIKLVANYSTKAWFALQYVFQCEVTYDLIKELVVDHNWLECFGRPITPQWFDNVDHRLVGAKKPEFPMLSLKELAFEQAVNIGKITLSGDMEKDAAEHDVIYWCAEKNWRIGNCKRCEKFALWTYPRYTVPIRNVRSLPFGLSPQVMRVRMMVCKKC